MDHETHLAYVWATQERGPFHPWDPKDDEKGKPVNGVHTYTPSTHRNAGNCDCGMARESRIHPHPYTPALRDVLCVCAFPMEHPLHGEEPSHVVEEAIKDIQG